MALSGGHGGSFKAPTLNSYISLADILGDGANGEGIAMPDNRDALIKTFGEQGITGFLKLVGAVNAVSNADEVQYWEEGRLHATVTFSAADTLAANQPIRSNDVILVGATRVFYNGTSFVELATGSAATIAAGTYPIVGNLYAQGTDQGSAYLESRAIKRTNPFMIMKETYKVTGSQATNIGWIDLGGGEKRWYLKSEGDTRKRFMDKREMMLLLGEDSGVAGITSGEGYFTAIEDRGIVASSDDADFGSLADIDAIITQLDKQGATSEYAMYVNRSIDLAIDDMLAGTAGDGGLANAYGAFNNSKDMAVELGFKSFGRGGYTFHKHDWKLLNDPTLLGLEGVTVANGVMIPMAMVADAATGDKAPALEMNYKAANGYSREMEHWLTGSVLGARTNGEDAAQFNYRSECNLVTRRANQHVLLK
jgi:hypothetical protein